MKTRILRLLDRLYRTTAPTDRSRRAYKALFEADVRMKTAHMCGMLGGVVLLGISLSSLVGLAYLTDHQIGMDGFSVGQKIAMLPFALAFCLVLTIAITWLLCFATNMVNSLFLTKLEDTRDVLEATPKMVLIDRENPARYGEPDARPEDHRPGHRGGDDYDLTEETL